ncbi:1665_t:CDS:2 [Cetraspora pellucida]|uniref:1665_t:CDS:1 n=1 Tax=Cetraspora pellucida TaxID=1433469 RepID=A0A9N9FPE9_9GLOM|nr:1665_t:CDS:2 [Cetraspora pellucida]
MSFLVKNLYEFTFAGINYQIYLVLKKYKNMTPETNTDEKDNGLIYNDIDGKVYDEEKNTEKK